MPFTFTVNSRYNRCLIWFIIIFFFGQIYTQNLNLSKEEIIKKNHFQSEFKWLDNKLYNLYKFRSLEHNVSLKLALCVVHTESKGKRVVSKKNKNGTRDYGRGQINTCHMPKNPKRLLKDSINSKYVFMYLRKCLKKAKGNISETVRMYNQGLHGRKKYYKNWKYVERIKRLYYK